jgi:hypothetical protein
MHRCWPSAQSRAAGIVGLIIAMIVISCIAALPRLSTFVAFFMATTMLAGIYFGAGGGLGAAAGLLVGLISLGGHIAGFRQLRDIQAARG